MPQSKSPTCWKVHYTSPYGQRMTEKVCYGSAMTKKKVIDYVELRTNGRKITATRISAREYLKGR